MTRAKVRGHRVAVDFRCCVHDRRIGILWVDRRRLEVLHSRLPGGGSLPAGWSTAKLECQICGLGVGFDSARVGRWLAERALSIGPSTFVWSIRADHPQPAGGMVWLSSRAISGAAAGSGAPARAIRGICPSISREANP